ncbi:MAG: 30S ribosome-binding factor RbfA [Rhodospirillales bacterium]|nr:30S ribosome-binding factor RbfA [Rhodospirillales bacterium]
MIKRSEKPVSQRQLRVGEAVRHALAEIFERGLLRDPSLSGVSVTVTEVKVSHDLRNAIAFVTPLGGGDADAVVEALGRAAPFLRRRVAEAVNLKFAPNLSFRIDESFDYAGRIEALLGNPEVARDLTDGAEPDDGDTKPEADNE